MPIFISLFCFIPISFLFIQNLVISYFLFFSFNYLYQFIPNIYSSYSASLILRTKGFRFRLILYSLLSSINSLLIKFSRFDEITIHLSQIKTRPAPWMARAYNPVGRAREARLQNMRFTCNPSLARNLPLGFNQQIACQAGLSWWKRLLGFYHLLILFRNALILKACFYV